MAEIIPATSNKPISLTLRLVGVAFIWCVLALALTGWGLGVIFQRSVEAAYDKELSATIDALVADVNIDSNGKLIVKSPPSDPRYIRPLSGYYWRVADVLPNNKLSETNQVRSRSLFDENLNVSDFYISEGLKMFGETCAKDLIRGTESLRIGYRIIKLPDRQYSTMIIVSGEKSDIIIASKRFNLILAITLIALAIGLIGAIILQVRLGLIPLRQLQKELAEVRDGKREKLDDNLPTEISPLARELNALLVHNQDVVERARTHVGNLAHALKTPISVMLNESREHEDNFGSLVLRQTETMQRQVEHYLKRARAAARAETLRSRTPIQPVVEDIVRTLGKLFRPDGITLLIQGKTNANFRGDQEDLEDLIGNLTENACKYGGGLVEISFDESENGFINIFIDDDGDGLSKAEAEKALKRGVRLDETSQGSGLGLSIADELARVYGGSLMLETSPLGGLRVNLHLPVIETVI